jgi:hypothetical protein
MNSKSVNRVRLRYSLAIVILATLPCYCAGVAAVMLAPEIGARSTPIITPNLTPTLSPTVTLTSFPTFTPFPTPLLLLPRRQLRPHPLLQRPSRPPRLFRQPQPILPRHLRPRMNPLLQIPSPTLRSRPIHLSRPIHHRRQPPPRPKILVPLGQSFRLPWAMRPPRPQALVQVSNTPQPDRLRLTCNSKHLPSPAEA